MRYGGAVHLKAFVYRPNAHDRRFRKTGCDIEPLVPLKQFRCFFSENVLGALIRDDETVLAADVSLVAGRGKLH